MENLKLFKNSVVSKSFMLWINNYPLSYHSLDMKRFEKFVIALFINNEEIPDNEFGHYLMEKCNFSSKDVEYFKERISNSLSLLNTYVELRK